MSKNESLDRDAAASDEGTLYTYEVKNSADAPRTLTTPFGPLHYMVAAAGLSLILFVIYVVYQQARLSQDEGVQLPEIVEPNVRVLATNRSCRCPSHANLRVSTIVADYSSAYASDSPPPYVSSVRYDHPPTYEEAVSFNYVNSHV